MKPFIECSGKRESRVRATPLRSTSVPNKLSHFQRVNIEAFISETLCDSFFEDHLIPIEFKISKVRIAFEVSVMNGCIAYTWTWTGVRAGLDQCSNMNFHGNRHVYWGGGRSTRWLRVAKLVLSRDGSAW